MIKKMNKKILFTILSLLFVFYCSSISAEVIESDNTEQELDQKSDQELDENGQPIKPDNDKVNPLDNVDINIIKRDNKTIETHSINGVVYKVKITPDNGPAYYFYDTDGDGSLETRSNRELSETTVQQWKIFQW